MMSLETKAVLETISECFRKLEEYNARLLQKNLHMWIGRNDKHREMTFSFRDSDEEEEE